MLRFRSVSPIGEEVEELAHSSPSGVDKVWESLPYHVP